MGIFRQTTRQNELITNGVPARAIVDELRDTGTEVDLQPVIEADLTVFPSAGAPFPATATIQGRAHLVTMQPGMSIAVRYDPNDPTVVAIG